MDNFSLVLIGVILGTESYSCFKKGCQKQKDKSICNKFSKGNLRIQ